MFIVRLARGGGRLLIMSVLLEFLSYTSLGIAPRRCLKPVPLFSDSEVKGEREAVSLKIPEGELLELRPLGTNAIGLSVVF